LIWHAIKGDKTPEPRVDSALFRRWLLDPYWEWFFHLHVKIIVAIRHYWGNASHPFLPLWRKAKDVLLYAFVSFCFFILHVYSRKKMPVLLLFLTAGREKLHHVLSSFLFFIVFTVAGKCMFFFLSHPLEKQGFSTSHFLGCWG
jgi:hypothetical protein